MADHLGRSHRGTPGRARIREAMAKTRAVLEVPDTHRLALAPASDTGAVEMVLWSMLGARPVDVLAWESFGRDWVRDVVEELSVPDCQVRLADYGVLPDLSAARSDADIIFTWNGTTSGVRVPNADWIASDRKGLTICDATSAVFAQRLDWAKLDVVTFSFQKALGGEGQHGVVAMSHRAIERLATFRPQHAVPKIFRMTNGGGVNDAFFDGSPLNTPSMLVIEDWIDALNWASELGGLSALIERSDANLAVVAEWIGQTAWVDFLAEAPEQRSNTSICLQIVDPFVTALSETDQRAFAVGLAQRLDDEGVAYDILGYRAAPPGLRVWGGPTVETSDIEALCPWLDWAFACEKGARSL